jgi:hypothetical protein
MVRICERQPNNNEAEGGLTAIEKNEPPTTTDLFAGGIRHIGWRSNCSDIRTFFKVECWDIRNLPRAMVRRSTVLTFLID